MTYVDGFLIPLPKKNVAAYRRQARAACKVWMEHGALEYRECVGDDLTPIMGDSKMKPQFPVMTRLKRGETIAFSWIVYRSKAHRDRVNANVMKDPRIIKMMANTMPFDVKRMAYGGFRAIVEA